MPRSSRLEDKYNNANSGLNATTFQQAIDELSTKTDTKLNTYSVIGYTITSNFGTREIYPGYTIKDHLLASGNNVVVFHTTRDTAASNYLDPFNELSMSFAKIGEGTTTLTVEDTLPEGIYAIRYTLSNLYCVEINSNSVLLKNVKVPPNTSIGSVIFYDGNNLSSTTSLLLDENFCSVATIDDRGYDWCNWQIGNNGSAFTSNKKSLGTKANPTPITAGTKIGGWGFVGDDGVTPNQGSPGYVGAEVSAFAIGDQNGTNGGTRLQVDITPENTKSRTTIVTTDSQGRLVLPTITTAGTSPSALYVDAQGTLQQGEVLPVLTFRSLPQNYTLQLTDFKGERKLSYFRVSDNTILTPPPGFRISRHNMFAGNFEAIGGVDEAVALDNIKGNSYITFYLGNVIYLEPMYPYSYTYMRLTSNNTDAAINYNTTVWNPIRFSTTSGALIESNVYPVERLGTQVRTLYNGHINFNTFLQMTSNSTRLGVQTRLFNVTASRVEGYLDNTYIRATGGANLYVLQGNITCTCTKDDLFEIQVRRSHNTTGTATLSSTFPSTMQVQTVLI